MNKYFKKYINTFTGLSREVWWLALITLINRAGAMILPFLSKYLKEDLDFTYTEVGWIMACFGLGSLFGSYLGGKLTDKIGFYKVMVFSLFTTGLLFIALQYITSFWGLCLGMFFIMSIADMFRPALFVSLKYYSKPENSIRSLTLIRLAINLGFAVGPTLGGLLIVLQGYNTLFWIDGLTCIGAILLFMYLVKEKVPTPELNTVDNIDKKPPVVYKDRIYWVFLGISFLMSMTFFQALTTLPIYHNTQFGLNEFSTGLLFFLNGAMIVFLEMPLIYWLESKKYSHAKLILISCMLMSFSFLILLINVWVGSLVISMIFLTIGEMIGFPYTNAFALKRAKQGNEGRYMGLYAMSFSMAHIITPKIGFDTVAIFGYQINWLLTASYGILAVVLSVWLIKMLNKENEVSIS